MSIEPGIAGMVADTEPPVLVDWKSYRACHICRAPAGAPCVSRYGRIVAGRPEGGPHPLQVAHGHRKRASGAVESPVRQAAPET